MLQRDKERLIDEKKEAITVQESWFDRYYRLANALYAQDAANTGTSVTSSHAPFIAVE